MRTSLNRSIQAAEAGGCGCSEPNAETAATCYCTVDDLVRAIARKYALSVLNVIGGRGRARFTDVQSALPRMSTSTLAETLQVLESVGLVRREVFPETPPRVEYSLSDAGALLRKRFRALLERVRQRP